MFEMLSALTWGREFTPVNINFWFQSILLGQGLMLDPCITSISSKFSLSNSLFDLKNPSETLKNDLQRGKGVFC